MRSSNFRYVYGALTSRQSRKDTWDARETRVEIARCAGIQFDPQGVEAFKRRYADIDAIRRQFADPS